MSNQNTTETLAEIHEKCLNLLASAQLRLPDRIHAEGLKGGIEDIASMTKQAYDEVVDD